jgi:two-component sensor histidine kinase
VTGAAGRVTVKQEGGFGELPAELATPLVMVLTELVGNAIEHGFAGNRSGSVEVSAQRSRGTMTVSVMDDGAGLPDHFSMDASDRLGLQIVRTLVDAELNATLELSGRPAAQPGTAATVRIPLSRKDRGSLG